MARKAQRPALACTECARRKQRCSKTIPCLACVDRGVSSACHREPADVFQQHHPAPRRSARTVTESRQDDNGDNDGSSPRAPSTSSNAHPPSPPRTARPHANPAPSSLPAPPRVEATTTSLPSPPKGPLGFTNETVSTLEFLTHGRRNILNSHQTSQAPAPAATAFPNDASPSLTATDTLPWDTVLAADEARQLLHYHRDHLAWMHNVVHMPTFLLEFEMSLSQQPDYCWMALYYAILATTLYHTNEQDILGLGILSAETIHSAIALHDRSIRCLHDGNFTSRHTIVSGQAVCVLLQLSHNFDQSDMISVLVAAAIKICQCLNVHRLGPDRTGQNLHGSDHIASQALIEREVKKRVWWFLIRQDWLQIPFQNTYLVHASQFNTPMPLNCFDDSDRMIADGRILVQPPDVYTQNSYSASLNTMAVIIWKHQDHMYKVGHPRDSPDGVVKLYDEVIWADKEIKKAFERLPPFLKPNAGPEIMESCPAQVARQASLVLLSTAHKVLTVHRHFQLESFRDSRFALTQLSCLCIAERAVLDVQKWPNEAASSVASKTWTCVTHLVTCCVILIFASIFRAENELLYDGSKMRYLAATGRNCIRLVENASSIARRGGRMLDALFRVDEAARRSPDARFDIGSIIAQVTSADEFAQSESAADTAQVPLPIDFASWDAIFGGGG